MDTRLQCCRDNYSQFKERNRLGADKLCPTEEAAGLHVKSPTYLTRSLDVQVVEPFQDCNSGHHPNGRVMKVAVQHLNYSIQIQGHLDPLRAAQKGERLVQCCNVQLFARWAGLQHTRGCTNISAKNPKKHQLSPWPAPAPFSLVTYISYSVHPDLLMANPTTVLVSSRVMTARKQAPGLQACGVMAGHGQVCPCGIGTF